MTTADAVKERWAADEPVVDLETQVEEVQEPARQTQIGSEPVKRERPSSGASLALDFEEGWQEIYARTSPCELPTETASAAGVVLES